MNKTTKQLLNLLVGMDGKGVWILHKPLPIPDQKDQVSHRETIEVQSYVDDVPRAI
jgi:hypothetical protein